MTRTEKDTYAAFLQLDFDSNEFGRIIPAHTRQSLSDYLTRRLPPGGFLEAVLMNDLYMAACRADGLNSLQLIAIIKYVASRFPMECWGSKQAIKDWLSD